MRPDLATAMQLVRFGALGAVGLGVNIAITVTLTEIVDAQEEVAFAIALAVVFVFSFLTSRHIIFVGASTGNPTRQLVRFALTSAAFRVAEYLAFLLLHTTLKLPYLLAIVVVLGVSFLTKFVTYSTVVFNADQEEP
ncbi:MAG: GtrA family protein [Thermoanaerobaculales bacterium]|nr:GtrA family protein [Thermoanaerobaculales bacterium]